MKLRLLMPITTLLVVALPFVLAGSFDSTSMPDFKYIAVQEVSRFREDRIAFQHVNAYGDPDKDNSRENMLIIKDRRMQLIIDGYDDPRIVKENRLLYDMERRLYDEQDLWVNRIDGKPDAIIVTDRRYPVMQNFDQEFVNEKFGDYYQRIRDTFVSRHVAIFKSLMVNRRESGLYVKREPLPKPFHINASKDAEQKYRISASAKTTDGRIYYCEDANGDGVAETFTVTLQDGFHWGYKSGPNIIFIYNNETETLKEIIGSLAHEAYYGTSEDLEKMQESISSQEDDITEWIENDLVHFERFYE